MVRVVLYKEEHNSLPRLEAGKVVGELPLLMEGVSMLALYLLEEEI